MKFYNRLIFTSLLLIAIVSCKSQQKALVTDGAKLLQIANNFSFTEGPASDKNGNVYFTDQPNNKILKWNQADNSISTFMESSGRANGLYFDNNENLLAAADDKNELWRIRKTGKIDTLITDFEGKKLNGPNDMWVDTKGGIYFTDPYYQREYWTRTEADIKEKNVYYISPDLKNISIVAKGLAQPNGIIGTPNGKTLYVADIGNKRTYSYSIQEDGTLSDRKLFTEIGSDGMTIDNLGNIYLTGEGVTIFNSKGEQLKNIPINENWTANVTFGGENQDVLFITAMGSVYTLQMNVHGVRY
ncbi:SMP-30/gluconolactonase/LRE family protein [uncultured Maribacter sp.]|uniref:SMP-30/gluconolactonase/LRE family protein n=1 Tax=uncultured Maribacter sp. TaxID=431308 RepID=UPI00262FD16F|nr:SMP-30/gluconolactonase/LRE family protein [uncultured Maribacter sp.]